MSTLDPDDQLPLPSEFDNEAAPGSTRRVFRLLQLLLANTCTRQDIFTHLAPYYKIDPNDPESPKVLNRANKMLERDLLSLEGQGFEILKERTATRHVCYRLVMGSGPSAPFLFTDHEVDSLALLYNLFADPTRYIPGQPAHPLPEQAPRHPFTEDILSLIERFAETLPPNQKKHFDRWIRKPYLYFNLTTVANYLPHRATIDTIIRAISLRQQISFTYLPMQNKRADAIVHQRIDPYYVTHLDGHFYLLAYSHPWTNFFEYRIDRIQEATLKIEPTMIDVERRRYPVEFRFWLDGTIAKRGLSERWLSQTIEREGTFLDEQGKERRRVLVCATTYSEWRIIPQLLKYGEKAELIEPPQLRDRMREVIKRMHGLYE